MGTNNLNRSVWDIDVKQYRLLFYTVRELYRSATIIFNAILPRWDSEDLYASSLYYNIKLNNLACTLDNCLYITQSDLFQNFDDLHAYDGLHLNFYGKIVFAEAVIGAITKFLTPRIKGAVYVPPELRKLWSPKPQRREKRRDNEIKERRQKMEENKEKKIETEETKRSMEKERTRKMEERKRKQAERKRKMEKARKRRMEKEAERRRRESVPIDPLVFIRPRRYAVPPRPPDLPPNQYIPDSPAHWLIPYVSLPAPSMTFHTMSDLPAPMSPYLKRKLLGKRKRIQARARKRKKHRKKVHRLFISYQF